MDQWHVPTKVHVKEAEEKLYGTVHCVCLMKRIFIFQVPVCHIFYTKIIMNLNLREQTEHSF